MAEPVPDPEVENATRLINKYLQSDHHYLYIIAGRANCDFTHKARALLFEKDIEHHGFDIDSHPQASDEAMAAALEKQTGQKTSPWIWIEGNFIGGFTELLALDRDNKLTSIKQPGQSDASEIPAS